MCREVWRPDGVEGWEAIGVYTVESEVWMNGTVQWETEGCMEV